MKNLLTIIALAGVAFFQSCAPVYIPNNTNVPLFTEKGEIQLAAYHGTNGTDLQAAVSVIDHLAVMGNFEIVSRDGEDPDDYHRHRFGEVGIGFYNTFSEKGRYEFYGGYGSGKSEAFDNWDFFNSGNDKVRAEGKYDRWFLQANIGLGNNVFEGALSYRLSYVNFYYFEELGTATPDVYNTSMEELMMEPSVTIKVGGENLKFVTQFGLSFPYDDYARFDYQPVHWSLGIQGKIPAW